MTSLFMGSGGSQGTRGAEPEVLIPLALSICSCARDSFGAGYQPKLGSEMVPNDMWQCAQRQRQGCGQEGGDADSGKPKLGCVSQWWVRAVVSTGTGKGLEPGHLPALCIYIC